MLFRRVVVARLKIAVDFFPTSDYNYAMTNEDRQRINNLIACIAHGDALALEDLSRLVSGRMFSIALSFVKNRTLAEDVVQESFVKILRNASGFSPDTNGYAWICKIVQNTALNALRSEKRFKAENIDEFFDIADSFRLAESSDAALTLQNAMAILTKTERLVIYQKYFMDFSIRDSAKSIGKSKSAVQRIVVAAEEKMRRYLNDS